MESATWDPNTAFINFTLQNAVDGCTVVREGENVTWIIDVNAFPRPNISWHNSHGFPLSDNKKYAITIDKTMQTILHILNARGSDSGLYVLRAKNEKITKEFTLCLLVRSKPVVKLDSPRIKYEPGNFYRINCTAKGYPLAIVKWSFKPCENGNVKKCAQPTDLPSTHYTQVRVDNSTVNSTLTITAKESGFVVCQAYNDVGISPPKDHSFTVTGSESGPNAGMIVGIIIVAILLLLLIGFLSFRIHKEKERRKELEVGGILHFDEGDINLLSKNLPIDEQADLLPYNKQWEFPKEKLKLGKQLGAGAFGLVIKAQAEGIIEGEPVTTVAVKMVKRNAEIMFLKALASELKIMVHLGKHLNVVNLLGACTNNIIKRELYVIVEYCPFGNVHNYLLRHREDFINQVDKETGKIDPTIGEDILAQAEYSFQKLRPKASLVSFSNSGYDSSSVSYHGSGENSETVSMMPMGETSSGSGSGSAQPEWRSNYKSDYRGKVRPITTQDLICWSFQIARGMEYLVSRKVMHGDLAARNILLAEDNIVKICDFGLAKSIYKSENYKKKGDGPLPIKWMALESIRDRIFSTQSDIWSYGIVLWELFSLATTPYPGMQPNEEFYNKLVSGYRMKKPEYATDDIYQLMSKCWLTNPNDRPSFTHLAESMGSFLDSTIRNHYISLNDPYVRMNQQWQQNRSDYLNMLNVPTYNNLVSPLNDESHIYVNSPLSADSSDLNNTDGDSGYLNMSRPTSPFMTTPELSLPSPKWSALAMKRKSTMNDDSDSIDLMQHL
ncbi:platelet-derived growth factor receptor alpha [Anabrus simplex]|uniref:platelet-derived growth factor receptor alpha n=1 Tax=Anabrus simplex TaxID=316456 RepID=UPI0035A2AD65